MSFFGKFYFASSKQHAGDSEMQSLLRMRGCGCGGGREPVSPPTDVYEGDTGYVVRMELCGVRPQDVEIHLSDDVLTVQGCRRETSTHGKKAYLQMEIDNGPFARQVALPGPVDPAGAEARLEDGMLEVFIPTAKKVVKTDKGSVVRVRWCIVKNQQT